jgi:hypothetical protein
MICSHNSMETFRKITLQNKNNFVSKFLTPISRIQETCLLTLRDGHVFSLVNAENNIKLYAKCDDITYSGDNLNLGFSDIKKLIKALDMIQEPSVDLIVNSNNIEYIGTNNKFKIFLTDESNIPLPKVSIKKLMEFQYDTKFLVKSDVFTSLIKSSAFITNSNKIYISTDGVGVSAELDDKTKRNVDTFSMKIAETYDGSNVKSVPFPFDLFKMITGHKTNDVGVSINTNVGVIAIDIFDNNYILKYVASAHEQ